MKLLLSQATIHAALLAFASLTLCAQAETGGLEKLSSQEFDEVYIAKQLRIGNNQAENRRQAYVSDVPVSFSEDWLQEHEAYTSKRYRKYVEKKYGSTLKEEIEDALKDEGWKILSKPSAEAITINPEIMALNIIAPEQTGNKQTILARSAGNAKVAISYTAANGQKLMTIEDFANTPPTVGSPFANRRTNYLYFKILLSNWASLSSAYIDSLMDELDKLAKQ